MSLLERSLAKLSITAFSDRNLKNEVGVIKAMYNPDSISLNFDTKFKSNQFINSAVQSNNYSESEPIALSLELIFDARMPGNSTPIENQLTRLRELCATIDPSTGEPHFVKVKWGNVRWTGAGYFAGRMKSLSYKYTLFDRDATPLRATSYLTVVEDKSLDQQASQQQLMSPPAMIMTVPAGAAALALMAAAATAMMVGAVSYLSLADNNDLDNLDDTKPGEKLSTPAQGRKA